MVQQLFAFTDAVEGVRDNYMRAKSIPAWYRFLAKAQTVSTSMNMQGCASESGFACGVSR